MNEVPPNRAPAIWSWSLDQPDTTLQRFRDLLSENELQRADNFVKPESAKRFVAARAGLRLLLSQETATSARDIRFAYGSSGKPRLVAPSESPIEFNLSHSAGTALCAIGKQPVGVDLEQMRGLSDLGGLARRWFTEAEQQRINSTPSEHQLTEFFGIWTKKEAVLKLVGVGVGESLPRVEVPLTESDSLAKGLPTNDLAIDHCHVQSVGLGEGLCAALATIDQVTPPTVIEFDPLSAIGGLE